MKKRFLESRVSYYLRLYPSIVKYDGLIEFPQKLLKATIEKFKFNSMIEE